MEILTGQIFVNLDLQILKELKIILNNNEGKQKQKYKDFVWHKYKSAEKEKEEQEILELG